MPFAGFDRTALAFIQQVQFFYVTQKERVEDQQHHFEVEMETSIVEIHGAEKSIFIINRNGLGVKQSAVVKQNTYARRQEVVKIAASRPGNS